MEGLVGINLAPELRNRRIASDYVAEALREAIINGQLEGGRELNQVELARHFQISRVPLREALRQLQAEGLVSAEAHRRVVVVGLTPESILEILELREVLESHLLSKSAREIDEADLAKLRKICAEMETIATQDWTAKTRERWLARNRDFHDLLLARSGPKMGQAIAENLSRQVERYLTPVGGITHSRERVVAEHREILDRIERKQIRQARKALEGHIRHTRELLAERFRAELSENGAEDSDD